ncbi:helix-turn-helix transcriptional regulator [Paenibacillus oenotherae]|uniref:Helix-turn-helix transcriptional regulator n=2 Tax=Paenibacillus oenotherae TaxID=1435645 RepID=A0ABS7DBH9_9BACL|nr:helix-turn-helix transcriptional regulator [Paenibacillus oenotherae]
MKRGYTQDQMAEQLGMNRANFSNYERDVATPPGETLTKIADMLNTSTDYLLGRRDYEIPEWATGKDKRDFKRMLEEDGEIMFDGVPMSERDRERVLDVLTGLFWDAKQMNKRKKKSDSMDDFKSNHNR